MKPIKPGDLVSGGLGLAGTVLRVEENQLMGRSRAGNPFVSCTEEQVYVDWGVMRVELVPNE